MKHHRITEASSFKRHIKSLSVFGGVALVSGMCFAQVSVRLGEVGMRYANVVVTDESVAPQGSKAVFECKPKSGGDAAIAAVADFDDFQSKSVSVQIGALKPDTHYLLKISSAGGERNLEFKTRADWVGRTPPSDFEVALLGACYANETLYDPPFRTPGGGYEVFSNVLKNSPSAALWLGGMITLRPADLGSYAGYAARYIYAIKNSKFQELMSQIPNVGVMGISAYGSEVDDMRSLCKPYAQKAFKRFWANSSFGGGGLETMTCSFKIFDAEFFVLDDCSARDNLSDSPSERKMFGKDQMDWLKDALLKSTATFKIVAASCPMLNPVEKRGHFIAAKNERADLLDFLAKQKIEGVMFVSSSKPYFELTRMVRAGAYELFEVSVGPATARAAEKAQELNYFKVPTSTIYTRGFVRMSFAGAEGDRSVQISICDAGGKVLFKQDISQKALKFEK